MKLRINLSHRAFGWLQFSVILCLLIGCIAVYSIFHTTGHGRLLGLFDFLNVGSETSLATFLSSVNLLVAAGLSYVFGRQATQTGTGFFRWRWLSIVFVYLAIDEATTLHENFSIILPMLSIETSLLADRHTWLLFGIPLAILLAALLAPLLLTVPTRLKVIFIATGCAYALGALGFELLGSVMIHYDIPPGTLAYDLRRVAEEGLEMASIGAFNWALWRELEGRELDTEGNHQGPG